jgi:hypothetical protein
MPSRRFRALLPLGASVGLSLAICSGCAGDGGEDGGLGGSGGTPALSDGRYVIEDEGEECDEVEGLTASAILAASGLGYEGELSWSDLETGEEASRTTVEVQVDIEDAGTITCIPFRHLPGQAPEYARLSYDAVTLSVVTDDGLLDETGQAVAWLAETDTPGVLTLDVVRALPIGDADGTIEVAPVLNESYETLVLVYTPSETTPYGHVSVTSEPVSAVLEDGDVNAGVPHGYFPALP